MISRAYLITFIAGILLLSACTTTKYVPEGDFLYKGATVKVRSKEVKRDEEKTLSEELEGLMRPKPNRKILGLPIKLWIYDFWGTPGEEKGLGNWIARHAGEAPVLYSDVRTDYQRDLIINRLENRGYFQATVERDSSATKHKIKMHYTADPGRQYLIDTVYFPQDSGVLAKEIRTVSDKTFLRKDYAFDLDVIKAERERINARLKEKGFYYFNPDNLLILVDSTNAPYTVSLAVTIKPNIRDRAAEKFTLDNIYIYTSQELKRDTNTTIPTDDTLGFKIIDPEHRYKPVMFDRALTFNKGDLYNRTDHNKSLSRLIDLGVFKYVENRFNETGDGKLDAYYYLSPYDKKRLRIELTGRNTSTNFAGAEVNLSWQNRNAFRAAENLKVHVYGGSDVQISGINKGNDLYRFGAEVNLNIPRFLTPFKVTTPSVFMPRTKGTIGYDLLNRVNSYVLNSFRTSFGYRWKETVEKEHQLTIVSVNYVQPSKITDAYREQVNNDPTLANAIQKQFIFGPIYNYNYTTTGDATRKHTFYFNSNLDQSGNIVGLLSGADFRTGDTKEILGAVYSQYFKIESDFRYYNDLGRGSSFAARVFAGFGFPYGNSAALPFVKQYFAGGTTGLRAFRARSLGPGTFRADNIGEAGVIAADQAGDIKLEGSLEYRPKISGILKGAIFVDAGNIWLFREDADRPGAEITKDLLDQVAVGGGVGLRLDFSFFVLRGDLAMPLRKPWYPDGNRWVFDEIAFGRRDWRRENLVFNLAIDYPF